MPNIFLLLHLIGNKIGCQKLSDFSLRCYWVYYPPASEASREVSNSTEKKNPHTPLYGAKEIVRLSVCLWSTLTPIISLQVCLPELFL